MARILIVYSSTNGHTREICERLRRVIEPHGHELAVVSVSGAGKLDLEACETIVIGASIRYGRHSKQVVEFIERNAALLNRKASAFFSVNVVARKAQKSEPRTNPYVRKLLGRISWRPRHAAVFAGKIDYPRYGFLDRAIIRAIMCMTGGPTDPGAVADFTDWRKVDAFGDLIARM